MTPTDFFISYRRTQSRPVRTLVESLEATGASVWFDQSDIDDFDEITPTIEAALTGSCCFVTWYSSDYPLSNACLHELEIALTHAIRRDELGRRVLIVNPERTLEHIVPRTLRDLQIVGVPARPTSADLGQVARRISAARTRVSTPLAADASAGAPEWFGLGVRPSGRTLIGRRSELFEILESLHAARRTIGLGQETVPLAQIVGMPGVGKTFLALEYARRFASIYPGGVFWFRAYGYNAAELSLPPAQREAARQRQLRTVLGYLDLDTQNAPPSDIDARARMLLGKRGDYLWIIDDIPPDFSPEDLRRWGAPTGAGKTLLTSRTSHLESIGRLIVLDPLAAEDGLKLLGRYRAVRDDQESRSATELVERVGGLPLALELFGARLKTESYPELARALRKPAALFEPAGPGSPALPTGHERDLLSTFASSLKGASPQVHRLLGFTSVLATAPIPFSLADACVPESGKTDDPDNRREVREAIRETGSRGLATIRDDDTFEVHALVQAAADTIVQGSGVRDAFSKRAVSALCEMLPETVRFKPRDEHRLLYEHAGQLTRQIRDLPTAMLVGRIGTYDLHLGNKDGEVMAYERQHDWLEANLGPDHRETIRALHELGSARGGDEEAALIREALSRCKKRYGDDDPLTLQLTHSSGVLRDMSGGDDEALAIFRDNLERQERVLGSKHLDTLRSRHSIAFIQKRSDPREALRTALAALEDSREGLGHGHPDTLNIQMLCGVCCRELGETARAKALLGPVLEAYSEQFGAEHYLVSRAALSFYLACRDDGDFSRASDIFRTHLRWLLIAYRRGPDRPLAEIQLQVAQNLSANTAKEVAQQRLHARMLRKNREYELATDLSRLSYENCDALEHPNAGSEMLAEVTLEHLEDLKRIGGVDRAAAFARERLAWLGGVNAEGLRRRPRRLLRRIRKLVGRAHRAPAH